MPKQKTHKGTARRMKVTGTGKVLRRKAGSGHLMSHKSGSVKRDKRKDASVPSALAKKAKIVMGGYGR